MKEKYFVIDIIVVILCIILLVLSCIFLTDIRQNEELIAYILMVGAAINMFVGSKGLMQKNKRKYLLPVSVLLFIMSLLIFFGFGG
ncbi:hypothetical protein F7O84_17585 [Candidatus Galacturonibacter soehngenii]|uniref:DUF3953 domain-containing protein n=2 Tax=Candidatus Galacturonatibacter soehngenii TaxID=2307010 RepID=A0A7V7QHF4_9FIRM|nr:hypothetical protein F7O84_17585 [Candidatus Galacturonibacter soehngenii]